MFIYTLGDILGVLVFLVVMLMFFLFWATNAWAQWRCKHDGHVGRNREFQAICTKCGKDLGSYIVWQKSQKE